MSTRDELVVVDIDEMIREAPSGLAKLFKTAEGEVWIPVSQIEDEGEDVITIPRWLAEEKGLV